MIKELLNQTYWSNTLLNYLTSISSFVILVLFVKIFRYFVLTRLKKWAQATKTTIDDFIVDSIKKIVIPFGYFASFYISVNILTLKPVLRKSLNFLGAALITIFTARLLTNLIGYGFNLYLRTKSKNLSLERSLNGILRVIKFVVWALAIIFFLDNLGFKISTVIAGLGIGGIAIGLAAQAILKDLFSYFSILFDRPFEVGDFIIIGDYLGTVEYIGAKTTRIRSLGGEQLIFSNTDLTDSRIRNYKRMDKRRVVFRLGVTYQTTLKQLKEMPEIIKNVIKNINDTAFDRAHFFSYGDFSLIFEVVYYVIGSDYNKYMDIQQEINFGLKEEFEKRGIEFAYPTQTLFISKEN